MRKEERERFMVNGNPDRNIPRKSQTRILIISGILIIGAGVILWIIGALQKQILETLHPGLIVDIFPPIGILIVGFVLCILGISLRDRKEA